MPPAPQRRYETNTNGLIQRFPNSIEGFWSQLKRSINAATFGGNQFHLPRAKFHESRGLDSDGIVVEHKQHGAVHRLRRDEFWSEILSGIDAISFFTSRR